MSSEPYNERVRACFAKPDHAGGLQHRYALVGNAEAAESDNGVRLSLEAGIHEGIIAEMRFRAWACPYLIAAAETLCADKENQPVASLQEFDQNELMRRLSVPVAKTGRILLLEDALLSLAAALQANEEQD
jgi:NifU-like protein involved in Fe-S cluster formation